MTDESDTRLTLSVDDFDDREFSPAERKRLRRILQDDGYARRFRTTVKVWIVTIGAVASAVAACSVLWEKVFVRLFK